MIERGDGPLRSEVKEQRVIEHRICVLLQNDRVHLAKSELGPALRRFPTSPNLMYFQAQVESREGDNAAAYASLRQLFSVSPEHAGGHRLLAHLKEREGLLDQTFTIWDRLTKQHPQDPLVLGECALFLLRMQQSNDARVFASRGLEIQPNHVTCLLALSLCDAPARRGCAADTNLETLLRVYPERRETGKALMVELEMRGRNREALEIARDLLGDNPASPDLVALVKYFQMKTHWSMWPLYPFHCVEYRVGNAVRVVFFGAYFTVPFWGASHSVVLFLMFSMYFALVAFWPLVLKRII